MADTSYYRISGSSLTDIADAIRTQTRMINYKLVFNQTLTAE